MVTIERFDHFCDISEEPMNLSDLVSKNRENNIIIFQEIIHSTFMFEE